MPTPCFTVRVCGCTGTTVNIYYLKLNLNLNLFGNVKVHKTQLQQYEMQRWLDTKEGQACTNRCPKNKF